MKKTELEIDHQKKKDEFVKLLAEEEKRKREVDEARQLSIQVRKHLEELKIAVAEMEKRVSADTKFIREHLANEEKIRNDRNKK